MKLSILLKHRTLGADDFTFRQLFEFDPRYAKNKEIMRFYDNNQVLVDNMWNQFDKDKRFLKVKNIRGRYYYVELWKYKDCNVVIERASQLVKSQNIGIDEQD